MSEKATVIVQAIEEKSGEKNGKSWTRFAIKDANGELYSTFDNQVIAPVRGLTGQKVDITFEVNGKFKNLTHAIPHSNGSSLPETYTAKTQDGEPDWDKKSLHITRCGLWNAFLKGHLAANLYAKAVAENKESKADPMDYVIRIGTRLVVFAEKDVFERTAGDDGVPF